MIFSENDFNFVYKVEAERMMDIVGYPLPFAETHKASEVKVYYLDIKELYLQYIIML